MSPSPGPSSQSDPAEQLEQLRDLYAESRRDGHPLSLESLLVQLPASSRAEAFRELLLDELTLRSADRESCSLAEYVTRFPHHAAEVQAAFREFQAAAQASLTRSARRRSRSRLVSSMFDSPEEFISPPG